MNYFFVSTPNVKIKVFVNMCGPDPLGDDSEAESDSDSGVRCFFSRYF